MTETCLGNFGDVNPMDHGGNWVFHDPDSDTYRVLEVERTDDPDGSEERVLFYTVKESEFSGNQLDKDSHADAFADVPRCVAQGMDRRVARALAIHGHDGSDTRTSFFEPSPTIQHLILRGAPKADLPSARPGANRVGNPRA